MKTEYDARPPPERVVEHTVLRLPDRQAHSSTGTCVLLVVEGVNDVESLRRISTMLHEHNPSVPDLAARKANAELVFFRLAVSSSPGVTVSRPLAVWHIISCEKSVWAERKTKKAENEMSVSCNPRTKPARKGTHKWKASSLCWLSFPSSPGCCRRKGESGDLYADVGAGRAALAVAESVGVAE